MIKMMLMVVMMMMMIKVVVDDYDNGGGVDVGDDGCHEDGYDDYDDSYHHHITARFLCYAERRHSFLAVNLFPNICLIPPYLFLQNVFKMNIEDFDKLPGWKQHNLKKLVGLFQTTPDDCDQGRSHNREYFINIYIYQMKDSMVWNIVCCTYLYRVMNYLLTKQITDRQDIVIQNQLYMEA